MDTETTFKTTKEQEREKKEGPIKKLFTLITDVGKDFLARLYLKSLDILAVVFIRVMAAFAVARI